ncbi:hypothetical protein HOF56_01100 [Candidatus Peribacteria bacterium]|jgi:hypothetical protein|nr:hypothetical protein [Candidatus Peribacteria bacterium]MBT4021663.1 hypothetical protein [Candidatus Peribacteria bacterium]MBT4240827.1 hypothetical protein [Candidatus Peribacteria bacterium]MBT4474144.1 hypothetical protein [Candidatus Peribacteria bacterium]
MKLSELRRDVFPEKIRKSPHPRSHVALYARKILEERQGISNATNALTSSEEAPESEE